MEPCQIFGVFSYFLFRGTSHALFSFLGIRNSAYLKSRALLSGELLNEQSAYECPHRGKASLGSGLRDGLPRVARDVDVDSDCFHAIILRKIRKKVNRVLDIVPKVP